MKLTLILIVLLISFNYSEAQSIEFDGDTDDIGVTKVGNDQFKYSVSRDTVKGDLDVNLDSVDEKHIDVVLTDTGGRIIDTRHIHDPMESTSINFSHNRLKKGTYHIKVARSSHSK